MTDQRATSAHKAYAAAVTAVLLYILNGLVTGEWASMESLAPALTVILLPAAVWAVPNRLLLSNDDG